ncbi:MAPK/MAK/MRK overlapping kinase [Madurella mycetomatis]|uniref:MAPK/MAK/MRK overlapping kinase n=1 Tax=Madurella mycetomatis TaxID=100816 RepID=A0A175VWE9_9PEZI|nr:MAPK/MAK/MRK overlapping kinase [Madurella mycetomatis]
MDEIYEKAVELVSKHIDQLPPNTVFIKASRVSGELSSLMEDYDNVGKTTYYPPLAEYQLPEGAVKTILRSEMTELGRLSGHLDRVSYAGMEEAIFRCHQHSSELGTFWEELHILARLPRHPNILPVDRFVLDEISGSRVVGYTTPFMPGGDLDMNTPRPFKFKYLKQLLQVVDDLNYKFGIAHQDLAPRNLVIDPATDSLVLFDFGTAARIGYGAKGERHMEALSYLENRNDVKGVVLTVHEIITRDPLYKGSKLHDLYETDILAGPEKWIKGEDVELDPGLDAADYYHELMRWVRDRRSRAITHYTEASQYIDWPTAMVTSPDQLRSYDYQQAKEYNQPWIEWTCPRTAHLDHSRRLGAGGDNDAPAKELTECGRREAAEGNLEPSREMNQPPVPTYRVERTRKFSNGVRRSTRQRRRLPN